ncbi:hypothetical protein [Hyphomicrobium sp.]|uniref:hypothetical protein n=1 Tax=Hyphomicrobium sp. TaxID=82 RepID=UPI003F71BDB9
MEQLGPEVLLALALVGVALILVTLFVTRMMRGAGRTTGPAEQRVGQAEQRAGQAGQAASMTVPAAQVTATPSAPTATPSPAHHKAPANFNAPAPPAPQAHAAKPAREPSYTEVAVAAGGPRPSTPASTQKPVDYSDAATGVGTGASYTAIAVAEVARAARNMPPLASAAPSRESSPSSTANDNAPVPTGRNGVGQSYTAVALATVGAFTPKHTGAASPSRIDYTGAAAETTAASSYTAIAVALAARTA